MIAAIAVAAALAARAPVAAVAALGLALTRPLWALGVAALVSARHWIRPADAGADRQARLFRALAAELRAGATLRTAVQTSARTVPDLDLRLVARRAGAGAPMASVADALAASLPADGRVSGAALRLAAANGGQAAIVFDRLADQAASRAAAERERRALTAQARLSALLVGVGPAALGGVLLATGGAAGVGDAGAAGAAMLAVGFGLQALGLAAVVALLRWAGR